MATAVLATRSTPIAELRPGIHTEDTCVTGLVTLIWPYASTTRSTSILLVEPDFRLRRHQGQVRIQFTGASAKAVSTAGIGIGERLVLDLKGAELVKHATAAIVSGKGTEWGLRYGERLLLQVQREAQQSITIDVDYPALSPKPVIDFSASQRSPIFNSHTTPFASRPLVNAKAWDSPAFLKRSRSSAIKYELFSEEEDDQFPDNDRQKRMRLGRGSGQWRFADRTPSPEKDSGAAAFGCASPSKSQAAGEGNRDTNDGKLQSPEKSRFQNGEEQQTHIRLANPVDGVTIVAPPSPPWTTDEASEMDAVEAVLPSVQSRQPSSPSRLSSSASSIVHKDLDSLEARELDIGSTDGAAHSVPKSDFGLDGAAFSRARSSSRKLSPTVSLVDETEQGMDDAEISHSLALVPTLDHEIDQQDHDMESRSIITPGSTEYVRGFDGEVSTGPDDFDDQELAAKQLFIDPSPSPKQFEVERTERESSADSEILSSNQEEKVFVPTGIVGENKPGATVFGERPQMELTGADSMDNVPEPEVETRVSSVQEATTKVEIIDLEDEDEEVIDQTEQLSFHSSESSSSICFETRIIEQANDGPESRAVVTRQAIHGNQTSESGTSDPVFDVTARSIGSEYATTDVLLPEQSEVSQRQGDMHPTESKTSHPPTMERPEQKLELLMDIEVNNKSPASPEEGVLSPQPQNALVKLGLQTGTVESSRPQELQIEEEISDRQMPVPGSPQSSPSDEIERAYQEPQSKEPQSPETDALQGLPSEMSSRQTSEEQQPEEPVSSPRSPKTRVLLDVKSEITETQISHKPHFEVQEKQAQESLIGLPSTVQDSAIESCAESQPFTPDTTQPTSFASQLSITASKSTSDNDIDSTPQLSQSRSIDILVPVPTIRKRSSTIEDAIHATREESVLGRKRSERRSPTAQKAPTLVEKLKAMRRISSQTPVKMGNASAVSPWFAPKRSSQIVPDSEAESETDSLSEGNRNSTNVVVTTKLETPEKQKPLAQSFVRSPSQRNGVPPMTSSPGHLRPSQPPPPGFRTSLSYFVPLATIQSHYSLSVDVLAIAITATSVTRATSGPRDYSQSMYITDPSSTSLKMPFTTAQIFRSHNKCFPTIEKGDAVLLRDFKVQSFQRQMTLLSTQSSAWAVFRLDADVQVRGPPVEFGAEERGFARGLWRWWAGVNQDMKDNMDNLVPKNDGKKARSGTKSNAAREDEGLRTGLVKREAIEGLGVDLPGSQGKTRKALPREQAVSVDEVMESTEPPKRVLRPRGARGIPERSESPTKAINRRSGTVFTGGVGEPKSE